MAQFLSSQYLIKKNNNPNNSSWEKKRDINKKDDDTKSEDKDDNIMYTAGTYVGEATWDKNMTVTPSGSSNIGT